MLRDRQKPVEHIAMGGRQTFGSSLCALGDSDDSDEGRRRKLWNEHSLRLILIWVMKRIRHDVTGELNWSIFSQFREAFLVFLNKSFFKLVSENF